jgi:pimeloyl-ACP methyl ester carboxylesterase
MRTATPGIRDAGSETLLLLPGLNCDSAVFAPALAHLPPPAGWHVCETAGVASLGAMAEHVLATAPPAFALAGHSMGGRVALEIVRRAPERVLRLALFDTGWRERPAGAAGEEERASRLALLALARERGMRAMGKVWVQRMVHPSRLADGRLMDAILDMIERHTPEQFAREIEALLARPDAGAVLRSLRCPTLVLCGRDDAWSTLAQHEEIVAMVPGARLVAVAACGHMAPMEQPARVAEALDGWLRSPLLENEREARCAS